MLNLEDIPGFAGKYYIAKDGSLYRKYRNERGRNPHGRWLKPYTDKLGYSKIRLGGRNYLLHRLVAMTYLPNPYNLPIINHIDNNPRNNNVDNLEWCTYSHNTKHAVSQGRQKYGRAKLTQSQVEEIRRIYKPRSYGLTKKLAEHYGVARSTIHYVAKGVTWSVK